MIDGIDGVVDEVKVATLVILAFELDVDEMLDEEVEETLEEPVLEVEVLVAEKAPEE